MAPKKIKLSDEALDKVNGGFGEDDFDEGFFVEDDCSITGKHEWVEEKEIFGIRRTCIFCGLTYGPEG